jgi:hypothetical protein
MITMEFCGRTAIHLAHVGDWVFGGYGTRSSMHSVELRSVASGKFQELERFYFRRLRVVLGHVLLNTPVCPEQD